MLNDVLTEYFLFDIQQSSYFRCLRYYNCIKRNKLSDLFHIITICEYQTPYRVISAHLSNVLKVIVKKRGQNLTH